MSVSFICRNCTDQQRHVHPVPCGWTLGRCNEYLYRRTFPFHQLRESRAGNYYAAGTGLLFCFTYLFVAVNKFLNASPIPFAWFSTFVAVNAVIFGTIEGFIGSAALGITPDLRWAGIWYLWAILWGTSLWRISAERSSENLCRAFRYLRALSPRGSRAS